LFGMGEPSEIFNGGLGNVRVGSLAAGGSLTAAAGGGCACVQIANFIDRSSAFVPGSLRRRSKVDDDAKLQASVPPKPSLSML
jgi:hypothetical protein